MATGEKELFFRIWEERPHYCFVTGQWLGHEPDIRMFAHVLPKGGYPRYRLNPENIVLVKPEVHHAQHALGHSIALSKWPGYQKFLDLAHELRCQYNLPG